LIDVAAMWPRNRWASSRHEAWGVSAPARTECTEALDTYRRHRERLAHALRPAPRAPASSTSVRTATSSRSWPRWLLLPTARRSREAASTTDGRTGRSVLQQSVVELFAADLLERATALYDPALPYHNAGHALRAVAAGERLLRVCSHAGVPVDATVVRLALLFHDAGYGTDLSTVGCADAEAYSAMLARRALIERVPARVLDAVETAILATRRDAQPDTEEAKVVRAADLAELAADYDTFATNSEALRVEHERLTGEQLSLAEWRASVDGLLTGYLEERLWPLELLDDDLAPGGFHTTAKANLHRYLGQTH
jgi:predicted metal-dependent HD superfamily phosphohydrolase